MDNLNLFQAWAVIFILFYILASTAINVIVSAPHV